MSIHYQREYVIWGKGWGNRKEENWDKQIGKNQYPARFYSRSWWEFKRTRNPNKEEALVKFMQSMSVNYDSLVSYKPTSTIFLMRGCWTDSTVKNTAKPQKVMNLTLVNCQYSLTSVSIYLDHFSNLLSVGLLYSINSLTLYITFSATH